MEVKTVKIIYSRYPGYDPQVIGVYDSEKVLEGIEQIKAKLIEDKWTVESEEKDCCNYFLDFVKNESQSLRIFTDSKILNEFFL
jgi:hypothetical protein